MFVTILQAFVKSCNKVLCASVFNFRQFYLFAKFRCLSKCSKICFAAFASTNSVNSSTLALAIRSIEPKFPHIIPLLNYEIWL